MSGTNDEHGRERFGQNRDNTRALSDYGKELNSLSDTSTSHAYPALFQDCQTEELIGLLANMLDRLIKHNDQIPLTSSNLTRFHSRAPPTISVEDYLKRVARYTNVEKSCLLIILLYIDRVCEKLPTFTISSLTIHRFLIAAVTVSSKALCDSFCTNGHYAKVGGISAAELNLLERELCHDIDWALTCQGELLHRYYVSLIAANAEHHTDER